MLPRLWSGALEVPVAQTASRALPLLSARDGGRAARCRSWTVPVELTSNSTPASASDTVSTCEPASASGPVSFCGRARSLVGRGAAVGTSAGAPRSLTCGLEPNGRISVAAYALPTPSTTANATQRVTPRARHHARAAEHHHFYQHDGDFRPVECAQINTWYSTMHAYLLSAMHAVQVAGGRTPLDESVVFFGSELSHPPNGTKENRPVVDARVDRFARHDEANCSAQAPSAVSLQHGQSMKNAEGGVNSALGSSAVNRRRRTERSARLCELRNVRRYGSRRRVAQRMPLSTRRLNSSSL
jgi:hypothetical protein